MLNLCLSFDIPEHLVYQLSLVSSDIIFSKSVRQKWFQSPILYEKCLFSFQTVLILKEIVLIVFWKIIVIIWASLFSMF